MENQILVFVIIFLLAIILYTVLVNLDVAVANNLIYENQFFPIELNYSCRGGALGTFQFIITYNVYYSLEANGVRDLTVKQYNYSTKSTYYVPLKKINKELLDKLNISRQELYDLLLLDDPSIYLVGKQVMDELLKSNNKIMIRIGERYIEQTYIIYHNYILVYRGMDIDYLEGVGNTSYKIVIARIYKVSDGDLSKLNETIASSNYVVTAFFLRYNGLIVRLVISEKDTDQSIEFKLENYSSGDTAKYLLLLNIYERIVDIDYGKSILFNIALLFATVIIWSISTSYAERKIITSTDKLLMLLLFSLTIVLISSYLMIYNSIGALQPLYYLFIGIPYYLTTLIRRENTLMLKHYLLLLLFSSYLVLGLFSALLLVYVPGSFYKLGIEAHVINETETSVNETLLLSRGLNPLLLSKELAYYNVMTGLYTQIVFAILIVTYAFLSLYEYMHRKLLGTLVFIIPIVSLMILINPILRINMVPYIINNIYTSIYDDAILSLTLLSNVPVKIYGVLAVLLLMIPLLFGILTLMIRRRVD